MRRSAVMGGIFIVAGTAIGAGMLALPIATGIVGFYPAFALFTIAALFMLYNLLLLLEVNLWLPEGSDIISIARTILGRSGGIIAWISYLALFWAVIAAYTAAGAPFIQDFFQTWVGNQELPYWTGVLIFIFILGGFVYLGTGAVDQLNRILMTGLILAFVFLVFSSGSYVDMQRITTGEVKYIWAAIPVAVFSFTSHLCVPALRDYLKSNVKRLVIVLLVGSSIPFLFYVAWEFIIVGIFPHASLIQMALSDEPLLKMTNIMIHEFHMVSFGLVTTFFVFFAVVTSFLGVSISLAHFLKDGLNLDSHFMAVLLTFVPPLFFVLVYPDAFIMALKFAGVIIIVLFAILTIIMTYKGRYIDKRPSQFRVPGGKLMLALMFVIALFVLTVEVGNSFMDWMPNLANDYAATN